VIWGAMHGVYLAIERAAGIDTLDAERMGTLERWGRRLVTFHIVVFTFLIFRCDSLAVFGAMLAQIVALAPSRVAIPELFAAALALGVVTHFGAPRWPQWARERFVRLPAFGQATVLVACLLLLTTVSLPDAPFIYFQF